MLRHQDVGGLEIAVNNPPHVGVLNRPTNLDHQLQPLSNGKASLVAELVQGHPLHQLHDEVGQTQWGRTGVVDLGDPGVIQKRQDGPLVVEPAEYRSGSPYPA